MRALIEQVARNEFEHAAMSVAGLPSFALFALAISNANLQLQC
jgi:hypothetical protein